MPNPLLSDWSGPFALPPFAAIADDHFAPAFDVALAEARAAVAAIAGNPEPPDFANTIAALELAEGTLDRVAGVFYNLAGADSTPAREALQRDLAPKMSAFSSEVTTNPALFARIEALWAARETLGLSLEQARVLDLYRQMFLRAGAGLDAPGRARMAAVKERLAVLSTAFSQNLLADERDWFVPLAPEDLEGLPEFVQAAAQAAGAERGQAGPVLTLNRSLIVPFLQFSPRRDLRARAFAAWVARGANGGETDNRALAAEILALREERAKLLGYPSFAAYKLEPEMARSPDRVRDLLMRVWVPAKARAEADAGQLAELLHADGHNGALEPWDWRYYSERRRKALHDFDEAALKPYLSLPAMLGAMFDVASRLFGLSFRPLDGPFYHPDVQGWEVTREGRHLAVFLGDYYARASKRSGAWCSAMRSQRKLGGEVRPIVLNVCNFAKGDPALLSWDDARTLFHEFGHALHQMLSDVTHPFISGTSVARDFVELPSQLFEHWLEVPEVLARHARHHQTGAPMPEDLRARLLAAGTWDQGFATVEYLGSALVDLAFHQGAAPADPMAMQAEVLAGLGMPRAIPMRHATPHFAHVFSGDGYSAGYYSYMWSEVMDADAFAAFEEAGDPFDPATAARLERFILSAGGSRPAEELYAAFRGRMPGVEPLLKGRGLLDAA
ncbi:peptidase M3 [Rhodobacter veldkampii DSM 11550]|uniref:Peptidase M3 n=1 Tax=Phaeovulum veldkampii DSM 11550 TaxID=1185920 RepID=A0A2T4JGI2_9RHOB|nr:M3 family metallopeptidase [Phaeovulum veldkampii]MBK5945232.1 peptidase M3 [Phaeovulum veldkampii DSM 11550]PTE17006.1 peptidase M3 [Phaeovulum veldkampii DSM 11550]TDQ56031.1 peptidyl-dipeptidase Dcp [Phaeovulum veldkampii DSM 11550]